MFLRIVSLVLALYNGDFDHQHGSHSGGAGGNEQKEGECTWNYIKESKDCVRELFYTYTDS